MRICGNVPIRVVDRHIDRDGASDRLDPIDELEEFFVGVMAILIGNRRIERQVDRQKAMPLHVVDELGLRQVVLRCLIGFSQLGVCGNRGCPLRAAR